MAVLSKKVDYGSLNPEQLKAVRHVQGPLLVLAGAGSGKTRVITTRVAHLILREGVDPGQILAVTFTNKAAQEMKERLASLLGRGVAGPMWVSTFHSFCVRVLRVEAAGLGFQPNFSIYDEDDRLRMVKECMHELQLDEKLLKPQVAIWRMSDAKNLLVDVEEFANLAVDDTSSSVSGIYGLYQKKMKANNAMDFDDLIFHVVRLFERDKAALGRWQEKFPFILIDEYQDINQAQYRLVSMLAVRHKNLCVVGDDDQSIYKFRGADIRNILRFEKDYPEAEVFKLEQNYRSTKRILEAAWAVVSRNQGRKEKKLWTENPLGELITYYQGADEQDEARFVTDQIMEWNRARQRRMNEFVILYRTNAQSRVLEEALRRNLIPYRIIGGMRFYDRMEVKDVLSYLKFINNPADEVSLKRVINQPPRGIGDMTLARVREHAWSRGLGFFQAMDEVESIEGLQAKARGPLRRFVDTVKSLKEQAASLPVSQLMLKAIQDTGYLDYWEKEATREGEMRVENIKELVSSAREFEERNSPRSRPGALPPDPEGLDTPATGLDAYLKMVSLASSADEKDDARERVTMMTLHNAKGLEFPVVFLTGMEENLFPHKKSFQTAENGDDLEEERRLCYVGITRAREKLFLTCAVTRRSFGSSNYNPHSRFLAEIPPELMEGFKPSLKMPWDRESPGESEPFLDEVNQEVPEVPAFQMGERVRHAEFGTGLVVGVRRDGEDLRLTVSFLNHGQKKLLASKANLVRLSKS